VKVQIILEGKLRKSRAIEWIGEYQKRLASVMPLELVEWSSQAGREEKFFNSIKPGDRLVALDDKGKMFNTFELVDYFKELTECCRTLYLFVGEAEGHSEMVQKHVKERWSLSPLTMSYEVALVVIAEQLYRNMTIRTGHPYHK
jgi:23S rRNA (pseudouridine1915-N3)-methyltransferase